MLMLHDLVEKLSYKLQDVFDRNSVVPETDPLKKKSYYLLMLAQPPFRPFITSIKSPQVHHEYHDNLRYVSVSIGFSVRVLSKDQCDYLSDALLSYVLATDSEREYILQELNNGFTSDGVLSVY